MNPETSAMMEAVIAAAGMTAYAEDCDLLPRRLENLKLHPEGSVVVGDGDVAHREW
jgi:hypothetical protein